MSPRNTDQRLQDIPKAMQAVEARRLRRQAVGLCPDKPLLLDAVVRQRAVIGGRVAPAGGGSGSISGIP